MLQPFRLGLNIGTDIARHSRILDATNPDWGKASRIAAKFLTGAEIRALSTRFPWYDTRRHAYPEQPTREVGALSQYLSGRWAAKEAARKAWDARSISFRDLTVNRLPWGQVSVTVAVSPTGDKVHAQEGKLSISHDGDYAIATVLAEPLHEDIVVVLQKLKAAADAKVVRLDTAELSDA